MKKVVTILGMMLTLQAASVQAQHVSVRHIEDHIYYLASDELQGRRSGSEGEKKAAQYIADRFEEVGLSPAGNFGFLDTFSLKYKTTAHDKSSTKTEIIHSQNIIGFINNNAKHTVVIGAHYDHLGLGHDHNSLEANAEDKIHNGADDNASGVAGLIEIARLLKKNKINENNNYLFVAFTAEELGLLGSKTFCENPTTDLAKVNYMINMDMIGRLNSEKSLVVSGVGTSDVWTKTLYNVNEDYFSLKLDSTGVGPSDHTSFYLKDVPVLHFFTGQHSDYHKSTDDAEKINWQGTKQVIEFIYDVILAADPLEKINFYKTKTVEREAKREYKVTMGIMPDYTADTEGLRIDGVTSERPAEKAGLQSGDIITRVDNMPIKDIYDYMKVLEKHKPNDTVSVEFIRGNTKMTVSLTF